MRWLKSLVERGGGSGGTVGGSPSFPAQQQEQQVPADGQAYMGDTDSSTNGKAGAPPPPPAWKTSGPPPLKATAAGGALAASSASQLELNVAAGSQEMLVEGLEQGMGEEEEGEEAWYYGAEQGRRGLRHVENQVATWIAAVFVVALALQIGVSVSNDKRNARVSGQVAPLLPPPPPSRPPPPLPQPPPPYRAGPPPLPVESPPPSPLPGSPPVGSPPPPDFSPPLPLPPPPLPAPLAAPPPRVPEPPNDPGWSGWLGRSTQQSTIGVCPCGSFIETWVVWSEQGMQATPDDLSPISGLTANCAGPNGVVAGLEVFPGAGEPDTPLVFPAGLGTVSLEVGAFLDNFLGVGGKGPSLLAYSCAPDELVTGFHVAWEPSPEPPFVNIATGVRVYCENPNTCGGAVITSSPPAAAVVPSPPPPAPVVLPSPPPPAPLVAPSPPPPAPLVAPSPPPPAPIVEPSPPPPTPIVAPSPPPPAPIVEPSPPPPAPIVAPSPPPPAPIVAPSPPPPPVGQPLGTWTPWADSQPPVKPIASGICPCGSYVKLWNIWSDSAYNVNGETGAFYGLTADCTGDTQPLLVFPGTGVATNSQLSNDGFVTMAGLYGTYINSLNEIGGTGPNTYSYSCPTGQLVLGFGVNSISGLQYVSGLQFYCGDPSVCTYPGSLPPPLPPPAPANLPGPVGPDPAPLWSEWYGGEVTPALEGKTSGAACPCGTYIKFWNIWSDPTFNLDGEVGALNGLTAQCSGGDEFPLEVFPGPGRNTQSSLREAGFSKMIGSYGQFLDSLDGLGGLGPTEILYQCPPNQLITAFELITKPLKQTLYVSAVRFDCGDPTNSASCRRR